jgi:hypothetical protein
LYWYAKMDGVKGHDVRGVVLSSQGTVSDIEGGRISHYLGVSPPRASSWIEWLEWRL